jgi:hypothetical protein
MGVCPVSRQRLPSGRGLELDLPFKDAGAGCGSFSLGHVAGSLQRDRERGMGQRVRRGERCERHRRFHRFIELTSIAESANKSVVGLIVRGIRGDGGAKRISGLKGRADSEKGEAFFGKRFSGLWIGRGHGCY